MHIEFEWDQNKNKTNIKRHEIDFCDAHLIFEKPMLIRVDYRKDYAEERFIGLGLLFDTVVVAVFTKRREAIRVISIRKANRDERKIYQEKFIQ